MNLQVRKRTQYRSLNHRHSSPFGFATIVILYTGSQSPLLIITGPYTEPLLRFRALEALSFWLLRCVLAEYAIPPCELKASSLQSMQTGVSDVGFRV